MEDQCDKEYVAGKSIIKLSFTFFYGKSNKKSHPKTLPTGRQGYTARFLRQLADDGTPVLL